MSSSKLGVVYLVGAGPGDPGLLTVRARDLLATCDAIAFDALVSPAIIAAARSVNRRVEMYDVGKRGGDVDSMSQDDITGILIRLAAEGKRVVRLKGGDPFVFGRGSEEARSLSAANVAFEVVPGITAGMAAPAYAGIPVTHRGVATSVTFVTGHEDPAKPGTQTDWAALARAGGTIVLYMGVKTLPRIAEALVAGGLSPDTPAAAVQWGTHARQRTVTATLSTLADTAARAKLTAPVITVIGEVVDLRAEIAWFDRRPLFGRRIIVTRASAQASTLHQALAEAGADVVEMPALRIAPLRTPELARALDAMREYDWIVFTSQNAVRLVRNALRARKADARAFAGLKIACVGRATSETLEALGIVADVVPPRFNAEALLALLDERSDVRGTRVLYFAAEGARDVLPVGLQARGCAVDIVPVYRTVNDAADTAKVREALVAGEVDAVTFASASAVRGYVDAIGAELARWAPAVSIGPVTSAAVIDAGITLLAEAKEASIEGLVAATAEALAGKKRRMP